MFDMILMQWLILIRKFPFPDFGATFSGHAGYREGSDHLLHLHGQNEQEQTRPEERLWPGIATCSHSTYPLHSVHHQMQ